MAADDKRALPGECSAVCADCGRRVVVAPIAGIPPHIDHEPECGRIGWPLADAVLYEDGRQATARDWPNGIDHATGRDVAELDEPAAADEVASSARDLTRDLRIITAIDATDDLSRAADTPNEQLERLGFDLDPDGEALEDQARELMDSMIKALEVTTTFELVLGTGHPDRRLRFECDTYMENMDEDGRHPRSYEIRRVLFHCHPWDGSAEIELTGEDREVAESFGRRVVPELGE